MKWKAMSEMTKLEIENLLKEILNIKKVENVTTNEDENTLYVTITMDMKQENGTVNEVKDELELNPDYIKCSNFSMNAENTHDYKQYMLTHGYSMYWKDNPLFN